VDLGNAHVIGVGINGYPESPASKHVFADIVLMNKDIDGVHPLLFELKKNALDPNHLIDEPNPRFHLPADAFLMIGDVISINKKKKQILIKDKNDLIHEKTVTYKHLIISSKTRQGHSCEQNEFEAAIHALLEAQRVRKNIIETLCGENQKPTAKELLKKLLSRAKKQEHNSLDRLGQPKFAPEESANSSILIPEKRLFEFQL